MSEGLHIENKGVVQRITLSRPKVHNAFDAALIESLHQAFTDVKQKNDVRVVVLAGEGKNFCAGADIQWMKSTVDFSEKQNAQDAMKLHQMLQSIYECPKPVISQVQGVALGGGTGLVACSDIAIASSNAKFALSEARLGILPAAISPFVLRKVGLGSLKAYALSAKRITAVEALRIGLVQEVVEQEKLEEAVQSWVDECCKNGPKAMADAKALYDEIYMRSIPESAEQTTKAIAKARVSEEGQEGLKAFLEKRKASWVQDS